MMNKIGFMQGRLVDQINDKIQAFPWEQWQLEFPMASTLNLSLIEWTIDDEGLENNPFLTPEGQVEIKSLMSTYGVRVASLTGDCFMQAPFWKCDDSQRPKLLHKFNLVLQAASKLNVRYIVMPLVDNGSLQTEEQKKLLVMHLLEHANFLKRNNIQIIFETDYPPEVYLKFLRLLPSDIFNVNYDIGNSASLGFDPLEEFAAYGTRIVNVHVKDRLLGGTTVPLGTGAANFDLVFAGLSNIGYAGNFILQTARATDNDHKKALAKYAKMTMQWLNRHYES